MVHDLKENEMVKKIRECEERVSPEVVRAVLNICFDIATKGREGKKMGTALIVGDVDEVMLRSHPLIINPYLDKHPRTVISLKSTTGISEGTCTTGRSICDLGRGKIHAAGRYLDVDARDIKNR